MKVIVSNFRKKSSIIPIILVVAGLLMAFHRPIMGLVSPANLEVKIQHAPLIMPSVYKVYANEDALQGKYSLFKMLVTNNSSNSAQNVTVSYQVPGYIEWTEAAKFPVLLPGQSVVVNCYPSFDQKIVEKTTSSKEKVNIKISGSNIEQKDESFGIEIKGRNEFMYTFIPGDEIRSPGEYFDNANLLTCLVTPEDPIIKYFTQKIQEKVLKGEDASVTNEDAKGIRFMSGIYYATLISHFVYSGTSGVPATVGDVTSGVQSIRLPREVVTGKTGLCIELSLLYASIMMNAGMDPIIFLVPGHAYPGFRMNNNYYAIEATGIGGEGLADKNNPTGKMTTQQALETGMKEIQEFIKGMQSGDDRYKVIDVRESIKKGAVAMELKDDPNLRRNIDEIGQSFEQGGQQVNVRQAQNNAPNVQGDNGNNGGNQQNNDGGNNDGGNNGGGNNDGGNNGGNNDGNNSAPAGYTFFQGPVTFAYPASWRASGSNGQSMPQLKNLISNSNNSAYVEVYNFPGLSSGEQCMASIQKFMSSMGASMQFQSHGQSRGYTVFNGQTSYNGGSILWLAAFKRTENGMAGIATGFNSSTGSKYQKTVSTILKSLQ
jgi:hypothetical protein